MQLIVGKVSLSLVPRPSLGLGTRLGKSVCAINEVTYYMQAKGTHNSTYPEQYFFEKSCPWVGCM